MQSKKLGAPSAHKSPTLQPKIVGWQAQAVNQFNRVPVAPFRPQPAPKVLQAKLPASHQPANHSGRANTTPNAPAAYRPQPVPRVLQTKSSSAPGPYPGQLRRQPVAPAVYRPAAKKIVQPKAISQLRKSPTAPPVYRPKQNGITRPKTAQSAEAHSGPKAPAVHRSQQKLGGVQPKMAGSSLLKPPVAPPVYRPQPMPRVLQTKSTSSVNSAVEARSGVSPGGVKVHYNSSRPAQLVYSQGSDLEVAEQESSLTHVADRGMRQARGHIHAALPFKGVVPRPQQNSRLEAGSIQCKPARVRVGGITHLVAMNPQSGSLYSGAEGPEITDGDQLVVETDVRVRSRRGPNHETFSAYDQVSRHMYRWYLVDRLNGRRIRDSQYYIREDTFEFDSEGDRPMVSVDLSGENRRTRGSHKLIRLEAWYNTDRTVDQTGHLIMFDYERQTYREYAISPDPGPAYQMYAPWNEERRAHIINFGAEAATYTDVRDNQSKVSNPKELRASERPAKQQLKYMRNQTRKKNQVAMPRFNAVLTCDVLVTQEEYQTMLNLFALRIAVGHYNFVYEALVTSNPFATRCLSTLEDLARLRRLTTQQGYADDILRDFITKATIDASHVMGIQLT